MANNWQIDLLAGLDGTQSKNQLNSDIKGLARNLDKLKLYAEIDKNQVTQLQNQLKKLQVQLNNVTVSDAVINGLVTKINDGLKNVQISNINVGNINTQVQQISNNLGQQMTQSIGDAIQKGTMQIVNGKAIKNLKEFKFDGKLLQNDVAKKALEDFKALGQGVVTVKEEMKNIDGKNLLNGFTINIKNAKGEVESLKYALKDIEGKTGQNFQYIGGSINDAGAVKQFEQLSKVITDYQMKLNDLKTKYSDTDLNYSGFEKVFNNFKQGTGTVNDLKLAFNQLQNSAKLGVQSLKSQSSSLDPIQQTLNNMRDLPSRLQTLQSDMGGLKDKTAMADISIKDLTSEYQKLQSVMTSNGGKVPLADSWTESYRNLMSTLASAENQVKALKKAETSDNSQVTKQANYYSSILSNYRQIYSLKQKLLTAGEEETNVIKEQIRSLSASNASINKQLGTQGLKSKDWENEVSSLKEQLRYSYRISEAKQKDIANTQKQSNAQKQSTQMTKELATAYQKLNNLKVQKSSLDTSKDAEKISQLTQEIQKASQEYSNLYNTFRKRKNFDSTSWKETKSAIDSATKSQIEYNNAKAKDTFNSAKNSEIANLTNLKSKWQEQGVLVGEFKTKVEQLESSLASVGSKGELDKLTSQIRSLKDEASQITQLNKIQSLTNGGVKNDYATQIARLEGQFRSLGMVQSSIETKTRGVTSAFEALKTRMSQPFNASNYQEIITLNDTLQRELAESSNEYTRLQASMRGMATEQQRLSLANTIEAWNQKNTAATREVRAENERYIATLRDLNTQMTRMQLGQINTTFKQTENSMRALNKLGASLKNQFKQAASSFTMWLSASSGVMKLISETREAVSNIKELDNILTEIRKTSDMTAESLEKLGLSSYDAASEYGRTSSDYLSAFESMARSGFYNETGEGMAKLSLLAQSAGDMSQEIADNYLLATNAAYKYGGDVEKLNAVLDGMNTINKMVALYGNI